MNKLQTDILIIGGGAAGMAAALSAAENSDLPVLVVDDNPTLGGQIWRSEMGTIKSPEAKNIIEKIEQNKIQFVNNARVFAQISEKSLLAETPTGTIELHFEKLILATGARERFLPFPGWTLPNVFGAGGLQALVKSGLSVEKKRIVVAGTGALLLAVAEYLKSKGGHVLLIAEQASRSKLLKFGVNLWREPKKLVQAIGLKRQLFDVKYLSDCFVTSAEGNGKLEAVNLNRYGKSWRVECDMLAYGFHLVPNIELASIIGCEIKNGCVAVNEFQETSIKNIYCSGEPTGIGGVELSLIEGKIAGLVLINQIEKAKTLFAKRRKSQKFANNLNEAFSLREELKNLPDAETIVCRCEDVKFAELKEFTSFREAKLQARFGMGACQGRICGAATEFLFDWENTSVRPPIFPVKLENLVD
jgi:NADPH-dependent 2,4-dienoyl-CoA reductase/sulfur reductase-like enzyme